MPPRLGWPEWLIQLRQGRADEALASLAALCWPTTALARWIRLVLASRARLGLRLQPSHSLAPPPARHLGPRPLRKPVGHAFPGAVELPEPLGQRSSQDAPQVAHL